MDIQILLFIVIGLLAINLLFVGIYLVLVLKEARETIKKVNQVLDTVGHLTSSFTSPVENFSSFLSSLLKKENILKIAGRLVGHLAKGKNPVNNNEYE